MIPEYLGTAMLFIQPEHCVPLQIIPETGSGARRLGGTPPIGIVPPSGSTGLAYFATLPLVGNPAAHVSIFVSRLEQLMCMRGRVNPSGGIEVCVHYALPRNPSPTPWDSHLSASRLGVVLSFLIPARSANEQRVWGGMFPIPEQVASQAVCRPPEQRPAGEW